MENKQRSFLISQAYATLFSVTNKIQTAGDEAIEELTSRQMMAFIAIAHLPEGKASLNAIASKLGATKQSTAQIINNLKKKGFLQAEKSAEDGRSINLAMTETGRTIFQQSNEQGWHFLHKLFNDFTDDELETLWKLLKKVYAFDGKSQDGFEAEGREL